MKKYQLTEFFFGEDVIVFFSNMIELLFLFLEIATETNAEFGSKYSSSVTYGDILDCLKRNNININKSFFRKKLIYLLFIFRFFRMNWCEVIL